MHRTLVTPRRAATMAAVVGTLGVLGSGCLSRPVQKQDPTLKTNFTSVVKQQAVDKVDILFMIDNSASMGDKQALLAQAVPDMIKRLINPNCLDAMGGFAGVSSNGACPMGQQIEFPPVHDMHIGVVSSSIGGRGSDVCSPDAKNPVNMALNAHNDDQAHLLNRGGSMEAPIGDEGQGNFLAWLPMTDANTGKSDPPNGVARLGGDGTQFIGDFTNLIAGVHEFGCGFEAQLESWYRFLVQPDPYQKIVNTNGRNALQGVDQVILQQRHDFLRPDSLLAVILVTDENEDTMDPMALGGQGWAYENDTFPSSTTGGAAAATSSCAMNPFAMDCNSCAFASGPGCNPKYLDPTTQDQLNVRSFHMKQRFGVDPQFPVARYIRGLTKTGVPNRDGEHYMGDSNYTGEDHSDPTKDGCINPIFATNLPTDPTKELCHLTRGPRTADLVFYALIGGVPHQLLQQDANNPDSPQKDKLDDTDWIKILGKDPLNYDFTGVDVHMLESLVARPGIQPNDAIIPGGDFDTQMKEREYACTFPIAPKNCADPANAPACDCESGYKGTLCQSAGSSTQVRAKAYPTIRELAVARAMGDQAIVSSLCPIHTTEMGSGDPLYGYRPAVKAIVDRLKNALANQCLPNPLTPHPDGSVDCLILETLATPGDENTVCNDKSRGFSVPNADVLKKFRDAQRAAAAPGDNPDQFPVCAVNQILGNDLVNGSCSASTAPGWCYVTGTAAGTCPQAILFSPSGNPPVGASISLQCIETAPAATDAGAGGGG